MNDRELMQQALDAMLNFPNDISDEMFESIRVLRARLAQPDLITHADVEQLARIEKLVEDVDPYTAPPQREWQGLTDEEIKQLWKDTPQLVGVYSYSDISREVEAKLKEKNNG